MKKIYSIVLMATALLIGTNAWADDITVVNQTSGATKSCNDLQEAIDFIGAGQTGTITLNNHITLSAAVVMPHITGTIDATTNPNVLNRAGQNITLNLNGKNIQGANNLGVIQILKGSLDITGTGEINRGSGSGADNAKKSVITVYGAPWSNKSEVWTTLTVGENVTVKTEAAEKVYGICIQNSSALPTGVSTTTLGYTTSESVAIASAPTDKCWAPASSNTKANSGCAYGVKLFVNGKVFGNYRGINVLGSINAAPQCDINENIKTRQYDAYPYYDYKYPYVNVGSTAQVWCINDGVTNDNNGGIYGGGYAVYDISGYVHGQTGIYLKAGDLKLVDAVVASDSKTVGQSANYHNGDVAGSGIFIGTDAGYAGGTALTIEGDTKVSGGSAEGAKGIVDELATNAQSTGADISHVTVNGGTIEGGISMTQGGADVTTVYGAQITGEVVVDGNPTTVATITPSGTHVTEIEINGKTTIVVSEGNGPDDDAKKTAWNDVAALSDEAAPADAAWTAAGTGTIGDGTTATTIYLGELQMISGTSTSAQQVLTIKNKSTLQVKNLIMNDYAKIIVEAGAKLIVNGEQGIVAPVVDNIVLQASATDQAVFLFNPAVTSNRHPNATVQMYAKAHRDADGTWHAQHIGIPTYGTPNITWASGTTYLYKWEESGWVNITALSQLEPFRGYRINNTSETAAGVYTFKGELNGNTDAPLKFVKPYYNLVANSYAAPMDLKAVFADVAAQYGDAVELTAWIYDSKTDHHISITKTSVEKSNEDPDVITTIAPMQGFILYCGASQPANGSIRYKESVWDNPNKTGVPAYAPARNGNDNSVRATIVVSTEKSKDEVVLRESDEYSSAFDNGADAHKYMSERVFDLYSENNGENYSNVATDNLAGTKLTLQAKNETAYTMSFRNVNNFNYALRDNLSGAVIPVEEGATYDFSMAEGTTANERFEIIEISEIMTAIDNVEAARSAKGIYTILGQYVGESSILNTLPSGIYVVDGQRIVK